MLQYSYFQGYSAIGWDKRIFRICNGDNLIYTLTTLLLRTEIKRNNNKKNPLNYF